MKLIILLYKTNGNIMLYKLFFNNALSWMLFDAVYYDK